MAWPESRCTACPASGDGPCLAQTSRHARFCQLADPNHPAFSVRYRNFLASDQADTPLEPAIPPDNLEPAIVEADPNVVVSPLAAKLDAINSCPHRSDTLKECSCTGRKRCALNRGQFANEPWAVTLADCLKCVSASE